MTHRSLVAERIDDNFAAFDNDTWVLGGSATYQNGRVRLTPAQDNQAGSLSYREDFTANVWETRFQFDIENGSANTADEVTLSWYSDGVTGGWVPIGGYQVTYDFFDDEVRLQSYVDGERKVLASSPVTIADGGSVTHVGSISYTRGTVRVEFDNNEVLEHEIDDPVVSGERLFFSARTGGENAATYVNKVRLTTSPDRNVKTAQDEWESPAVDIGTKSNTYALVNTLTDVFDQEDKNLSEIRRAHHIDTATGEELEQFGRLVQLDRKQGELDSKYRARLKVQYRVGNIGTTFDEFAEFTSTLLSTDLDNIEFVSDLAADPATAQIAADLEVFNAVSLSESEIIDFLGEGVPAGHEVKVLERGTFRLKSDGDPDDPDKGLTGDSISTGGTLAADLV
jgi:hypothetical protein